MKPAGESAPASARAGAGEFSIEGMSGYAGLASALRRRSWFHPIKASRKAAGREHELLGWALGLDFDRLDLPVEVETGLLGRAAEHQMVD